MVPLLSFAVHDLVDQIPVWRLPVFQRIFKVLWTSGVLLPVLPESLDDVLPREIEHVVVVLRTAVLWTATRMRTGIAVGDVGA